MIGTSHAVTDVLKIIQFKWTISRGLRYADGKVLIGDHAREVTA
jgi:hypothetical protein